MVKEIARGAEAVLYMDGDRLVKDRIKKGYRLPELDTRIRKLRTRREEKLLERARRAGISTPKVFDVSENKLTMEFIDGERVKDIFNGVDDEKRKRISGLIGKALGRMHSANIVHGDFTTSNMILKEDQLFIIDLGLGKYSERSEDKAVDLYLLYEALKSVHFSFLKEAWQKVLKSYRKEYKQARDVLLRFDKISMRRRYKGG